MSTNWIIAFLFLLLPGDGHYRLTINVSGLKPLKGELYIGLHNRPEFFQVPDSAFMKQKITVKKEAETLYFDHIPEGTYAIAVYHDENLNAVMDVNEIGIPREGYGFSTKNKTPGRPKFEQASFSLNGNDTVEIKMIYHPVPAPKNDKQ